MRASSIKAKRKKKAIRFVNAIWLILILFFITLVVYVVLMTKHIRLQERIASGDIFSWEDKAEDSEVYAEAKLSPEAMEKIESTDIKTEEVLPEIYKSLKEDNPDFAGFISIQDTKISYPVMYSGEDPEKYLTRDINGVSDVAGIPFIDSRCKVDPDSDNIIIYGHHMKDGSMFGDLDEYESEDYFKAHPVIRFDSFDEIREYKVMAAFYDRVYYDDEDEYRFYDFIDAEDENDFDRNVSQYLSKSLYDTGVTASYGDKLVTLVTCAYHEENGRFVVVGVHK